MNIVQCFFLRNIPFVTLWQIYPKVGLWQSSSHEHHNVISMSKPHFVTKFFHCHIVTIIFLRRNPTNNIHDVTLYQTTTNVVLWQTFLTFHSYKHFQAPLCDKQIRKSHCEKPIWNEIVTLWRSFLNVTIPWTTFPTSLHDYQLPLSHCQYIY